MSASDLSLLALLVLPAAHALAVLVFARANMVRAAVHVIGAVAVAAGTIAALVSIGRLNGAHVVVAYPLPNLAISFTVEPLGVVVAATIGVCAALVAIGAAGYVHRTRDPEAGRLMIFSAFAAACAIWLCFAGDLFTMFALYEALALACLPLAVHGRAADRKGPAMMAVLAAGAALLAPAVVWTVLVAERAVFAPGGMLAGRLGAHQLDVLLALYVLGAGLTGLAPSHRWVGASAAAAPPAAALVLVLAGGGGGFVLVRIAAHVFGPALDQAAIGSALGLALAAFTAASASIAALAAKTWPDRIAQAAGAQLALVAFGALLGVGADGVSSAGWFGAALQLIAFMLGSVTLTLAAASGAAASGTNSVDGLVGAGRDAPWAFAALALGALSYAGAPPLAGAWPKLWLLIAAVDDRAYWVAAFIAATALCAFAALAAPAARTLFAPRVKGRLAAPDGAPALLVAPAVAASALLVALVLAAEPVARWLAPLRTGAAP